MNPRIRDAADLLRNKRNILIYSGAGLDADSGVPTFDERISDSLVDWGIDRWRNDAEWRREVWSMYSMYADLKPNAAHDAILQLVDAGVADHVTSNVTGLSVGATELCGSAMELELEWVNGERLTRPNVTFIGEHLPSGPMEEYFWLQARMDALLIVGASPLIGIWMAAALHAKANDIPIVVINKNPEPIWSEFTDVMIQDSAVSALPKLVGLLQSDVQAQGGEL